MAARRVELNALLVLSSSVKMGLTKLWRRLKVLEFLHGPVVAFNESESTPDATSSEDATSWQTVSLMHRDGGWGS